MSERSAESSIKGYTYQFLHTIKDIMTSANSTDICTVEGVEDFDIKRDTEKELIQYKYHEEQKFLDSRVAKPIGIMFNHFLNNQGSNDKYKLFIYLNETEMPDLTKEKIIRILKLKTSTDHFDKKRNIYELDSKKHSYAENETFVNLFIEKFDWVLTKKYDELESELISILSRTFTIPTAESKFLYLSNAIKIISDLSIKPDGQRDITKEQFVTKLKTYEKIVFSSLIFRIKGFNELKKLYKKQKQLFSINKNSASYIVQINDISKNNLNQLIVELSKKFCYIGNKCDYRPITFIINCSLDKYKEFKRSIVSYITSQCECIKINDGFEDYCFNINVFNELLIKTKSGNKFDIVSFNFKLLHQEVFTNNFEQINYSNVGLFVLDDSNSSLSHISAKQFFLNNLTPEQIIEIIGE